ncbi:MAG: adenylyl-sulfate kinase [Proteobacteria bacterium]|nr:adenylyl-sulfate kinase [Pseudomonadota bacterium]
MSSKKSTNVVWHNATVTRETREELNKHKSTVLWFTGLSGSGKSTLAHAVEELLYKQDCRTFVLDGDNVRHGLCGDLGFSIEDRTENIRRVGEVAKLFVESGLIVLTAFISPLKSDRNAVRNIMPHGDFIEIYCAASLDVCESRDVKGLYKKARSGEIPEFTGISSPYEEPVNPEIVVNTGELALDACAEKVLECLKERGILINDN